MQFDEAQRLASRLRDELGRAIIGQQAVVQEILTAFFAGGHVPAARRARASRRRC